LDEGIFLGLCPKCDRNSVFYDPYFKIARCCYKSCGFKKKVENEDSYFDSFEKNTEEYKRRMPSYDLSFAILRRFADAYRLNGYINPMQTFYFFSAIDHYTGESATSLEEFVEKIKKIDIKALEFHFWRRDFERWIAQSLGDKELSKEISELHIKNFSGETLRIQIHKVISRRLTEAKRKVPITA